MSVKAEPPTAARPPPAGTAFLAGFAIANVGAFAGFLPLLQVLVPLQAVRIAAGGGGALLAVVAATGAAVAGAANLLAGWASDRTRSRLGRRRPWMLAGAFGAALSYALVLTARSPVALLAAVAVFQAMFNVMFAPLVALICDRAPERDRGWISALASLGFPLGTAVGAAIVGLFAARPLALYAAPAAVMIACVVPFALRLSPHARAAEAAAPGEPRPPSSRRDFLLGAFARVCVLTAFSTTQTFLLIYVLETGGAKVGGAPAAERVVALLGAVFAALSAASCLVVGRLSDRTGRRRPFAIAGALVVAAGMAGLALAPDWRWMAAAYAVYALGAGCHVASELAMMVGLLPSRDRPGRDLGLLNLANIGAQVAAPLGAGVILGLGGGVRPVLAAAALASAVGAAALAALRRAP